MCSGRLLQTHAGQAAVGVVVFLLIAQGSISTFGTVPKSSSMADIRGATDIGFSSKLPESNSAAPIHTSSTEQLLSAARGGDRVAQYLQAKRYYTGVGVPEDRAEAVRWCRKAA